MNKYKISGSILLIIDIICEIIGVIVGLDVFSNKVVLVAIVTSALGLIGSICLFFGQELYERESELVNDGHAHLFTLNEKNRWLCEQGQGTRRFVGNTVMVLSALVPVGFLVVILLCNKIK